MLRQRIIKHHLLTHYARVIREMSPVVFMSMIRFESKHKYFKNCVKKTNNFININNTLAVKHQQFMCEQLNGYQDGFSNSAMSELASEFIEEHEEILKIENRDSIIYEVKWLRCNGIRFRSGCMLLKDSMVFEIVKILIVQNNWKLYCVQYDCINVPCGILTIRQPTYVHT